MHVYFRISTKHPSQFKHADNHSYNIRDIKNLPELQLPKKELLALWLYDVLILLNINSLKVFNKHHHLLDNCFYSIEIF